MLDWQIAIMSSEEPDDADGVDAFADFGLETKKPEKKNKAIELRLIDVVVMLFNICTLGLFDLAAVAFDDVSPTNVL